MIISHRIFYAKLFGKSFPYLIPWKITVFQNENKNIIHLYLNTCVNIYLNKIKKTKQANTIDILVFIIKTKENSQFFIANVKSCKRKSGINEKNRSHWAGASGRDKRFMIFC